MRLFHRTPKAVRAQIGEPYDKDKLQDAFIRAGVREWKVIQNEWEEPNKLKSSIHYQFITGWNVKHLTFRDRHSKKLGQKIMDRVFAENPDFEPPVNPTLEEAVHWVSGLNLPDLMNSFQNAAQDVMAPDLKRLDRKVKGERVYPWDHLRYKIDRVYLPHREQTRPSTHMFVAQVAGHILRDVSYK